jgi:UDP-GlcNAc3NAcA epimerase
LIFRIFTIVGARPQFIKAAAISRAIRNQFSDSLEENIVHTGQHYDAEMSDVFFDELEIPKPAFHLHVGSSSHGKQTGAMIEGIENLLLTEKPDMVLVYGDTNSTLAGALAASKIHIPVVHVEAGLRSFNKDMPEEINRILTDHVSTLLFSPTKAGIENLKKEGFFNLEGKRNVNRNNPAVLHCGDVMFDNALYFKTLAEEKKAEWLASLGLEKGKFILSTIHRNANTDEPSRLKSIFEGLLEASEKLGARVVLPLHPRTQKMLALYAGQDSFFSNLPSEKILVIPPASYLEMVLLESQCQMVITDSGGVQKEAYFYEKPCIVLRPETEWVELVEAKAAILADASAERILEGVSFFQSKKDPIPKGFYGDGNAASFICSEILGFLKGKEF